MFITSFTRARNLSLSWARWIQSKECIIEIILVFEQRYGDDDDDDDDDAKYAVLSHISLFEKPATQIPSKTKVCFFFIVAYQT